MSDEEWDADDFQPPPMAVIPSDKWEGEDEDANIKDNWDDDKEEEDEEKKPAGNGEITAQQIKKKRPVKERLAEKAEQRRKEQEEKRKAENEEKPLTAQEIAAEKLRQQKLQEDADLELAIQAFGVNTTEATNKGLIDGMEPSTKEEFDKFEELLQQKITKYEKSAHYVNFLESLFRQLAIDLEAEDIKRLSSTLTALSNEKVKQQKSAKGGKKQKPKAKLILGKETDAFVETSYDDYDDFI